MLKTSIALALIVAVVLAGAAWAGLFTPTAASSCCFEGSPCCFPGSPCCEGVGDCCFAGSPCCFAGSPCCEQSASTSCCAQ